MDAILRPPVERGLVSDGLVYRYNAEETPDGLRGVEGTFNICTFWLVEALTRMGKVERHRLEEARQMFERMLGYANHLGYTPSRRVRAARRSAIFPRRSRISR